MSPPAWFPASVAGAETWHCSPHPTEHWRVPLAGVGNVLHSPTCGSGGRSWPVCSPCQWGLLHI